MRREYETLFEATINVARHLVEHLLARSGFQLEHVYVDYDKSPYGSKYPGELITVAKKVAS